MIWSLTGLFTLSLVLVFYMFPVFTEVVYSAGIFVFVRWVIDHTIGLLPFSIFYFIIIYLLINWGYKLYKWIKFNTGRKDVSVSLSERMGYTFLSLFAYLSKVAFFFFFLWGFNYFRVPVEEKLNLELYTIEKIDLYQEANYARKAAIEARKMTGFPTDKTFTFKDLPVDMEDRIRENMEKVLKSMRYPTVGDVKIRYIRPDGFLNSLGISGFYNPFLGEANLDKSFSPLYLPFLIAHEMVHGYGFADEGTANFLAYLTCENASNPIIKYSGRITYLLYLSYHLAPLKIHYNEALRNDISSQGYFSSQPQYDRMIMYVSAWRKKYAL